MGPVNYLCFLWVMAPAKDDFHVLQLPQQMQDLLTVLSELSEVLIWAVVQLHQVLNAEHLDLELLGCGESLEWQYGEVAKQRDVDYD